MLAQLLVAAIVGQTMYMVPPPVAPIASGNCYSWSGQEQVCSPADGKIQFINNAGNTGYCIDFTTSPPTFKNQACSSTASLVLSQPGWNPGPAWDESGDLTAGTMALNTGITGSNANVQYYHNICRWTNAQVSALGAVTTGNVSCAVLPAKTVVVMAYITNDTTAGGTTTLTASVGQTATTYTDYVGASNMQATAGTIYSSSSASGRLNAPATGTTTVNVQFISTGANLSAVTTSTGHVDLFTTLLF